MESLTSDVPPWVRFILLYDHSVFVSCNIFGRLIECPDPPEGKNDVRGDSGDKTDRNWAAPSLVTISSRVIFRYHRSMKNIILNREFNQIAWNWDSVHTWAVRPWVNRAGCVVTLHPAVTLGDHHRPPTVADYVLNSTNKFLLDNYHLAKIGWHEITQWK